MLAVEQALKLARRALRYFAPDEKFSFVSLKDPGKKHDVWVFRGTSRSRPMSVICKLSSADAQGRAKILHQFNRLQAVYGDMPVAPFSVARPLAVVPEVPAFIMADVAGETLLQRMQALGQRNDAEAMLALAGRWLRAFQQPALHITDFKHKSHTNSLIRKIQSQQSEITIPDYAAFMVHFAELEALADQTRGLACLRCVSHRDFHLGNLIFTMTGGVIGIDFENNAEDEALRDVMSFLFDYMVRAPHAMNFLGFQRAARAFWAGYSDQATPPKVIEYFQRFTALQQWANLGNPGRMSDFRQRKLVCLKQLAARPLFDS